MGSPIWAATEAGTKAPARNAEMARGCCWIARRKIDGFSPVTYAIQAVRWKPTIAAVTVKITSISERFDNTTFADAVGSDMAILLCRQSYFPTQFAAVHGAAIGRH